MPGLLTWLEIGDHYSSCVLLCLNLCEAPRSFAFEIIDNGKVHMNVHADGLSIFLQNVTDTLGILFEESS